MTTVPRAVLCCAVLCCAVLCCVVLCCVVAFLKQGPAEANNGGALEALVQTCIGSSLKRAEMVELTVVTRDMRRLAVAVQAYPLGTPDGATTHLLLVMEEIPVCTPLPQGGES